MTRVPRKGPQDARQRSRGAVVESTDAETAQGNSAPYCTGCAHDLTNHRGGRCWTDALGEPIQRTRTLIACDCRELTK